MSYAIHAPDDERIGFPLFAGESDPSGDCLFRAFPPSHTPVSALIDKLREQSEFLWRMEGERACIFSADGSKIGSISDGPLTIGGVCLPVVDMTDSWLFLFKRTTGGMSRRGRLTIDLCPLPNVKHPAHGAGLPGKERTKQGCAP